MGALDQRVIDLAYGGHGLPELANVLGVDQNHVRDLLRDVTRGPSGAPAPGSLGQRAVDLAYSGHPVSEIADALGLGENAVRAALQDPGVAPTPVAALTGVLPVAVAAVVLA